MHCAVSATCGTYVVTPARAGDIYAPRLLHCMRLITESTSSPNGCAAGARVARLCNESPGRWQRLGRQQAAQRRRHGEGGAGDVAGVGAAVCHDATPRRYAAAFTCRHGVQSSMRAPTVRFPTEEPSLPQDNTLCTVREAPARAQRRLRRVRTNGTGFAPARALARQRSRSDGSS